MSVQRLPHLLQTGPLGRQRGHHAAERAVHCRERWGRQSGTRPPTLPPPGPPARLSTPLLHPTFLGQDPEAPLQLAVLGGEAEGQLALGRLQVAREVGDGAVQAAHLGGGGYGGQQGRRGLRPRAGAQPAAGRVWQDTRSRSPCRWCHPWRSSGCTRSWWSSCPSLASPQQPRAVSKRRGLEPDPPQEAGAATLGDAQLPCPPLSRLPGCRR